jgi:hypothetical protein
LVVVIAEAGVALSVAVRRDAAHPVIPPST